jgi:membrane-associated phospholipid phosphatase
MQAVMAWGIDVILWIQSMRIPVTDAFFRAVTQLGGIGHLWIVPALVWSLSYRMGARVLIAMLVSAGINFGLKDLFAQPRPFELEPRIGPDRELGYGIPSGHAQHTAVQWTLVAAWARQPWCTGLAIVLIFLIGFSRIYLGVHFPSDVLAGWGIAAALVWLQLRYGAELEAALAKLGTPRQIALAGAGSLLFVLIYLLLPKTTWLVGTGGLFFGAAGGVALCLRWLRPPERGAGWQRLLRYVVGMVPLLLWARVAGGWVPEVHNTAYFAIIYANCAVAGFWITAGAPAAFQALRLTPAP